MESQATTQYGFYDILYFLKRNYKYIILVTLLSVFIGALITLRTKPVFTSFSEIEIVEDDNSGFGKMSGFEAFVDQRSLSDKIRNIGLRPIAEKTIDKLIKPVNSVFLTKDNKLLYNYNYDKIDTLYFTYNGESKKIKINVTQGCGVLYEDVRVPLGIKKTDTNDVLVLSDNSLNNNFKISDTLIPDGEYHNGCDLPDFRQMYLLNTKKYKYFGLRKTFKNIITMFGLFPIIDKNDDFSRNESFSDGEIRFFVKKLQESLFIEPVKETSHLVITVKSFSPNEAADLANCVIDSYIEEEIKIANKRTSAQIKFLKKDIKLNSDILKEIEDKIQDFQQEEDILSVDGNVDEHVGQFLKLKSDRVTQKLKLKDLIYSKQIFEDEIIKQDIPKSYELSVKDTLRSLNINIELVNNRIENIAQEISSYQEFLDDLPRKTREFNNLKERKIEISTENIFLTEKLKNAELIYNSAQPGLTIRVDAKEDFERLKPSVFENLLISFIVGIIIGILGLFTIEYFNNSIKTIEDLERYGLNVLAIIPSIGKKNKSTKGKNIERTLITREDPKSPISEAYRTLRTSIMYSSENKKDAKIVMVSSPGPGEGKTTTVANLAITYANLGKKTLLIDADLRKPVVDKVFDLKKVQGLTKYIVENINIKSIIQNSSIDNLDIVTSGVIPPNPSELLDSNKMRDLFDNIKLDYDIILIDTPPIIAVTDALIISKYVDNFILVCRSGQTQKGALDRSIKSLKLVGGKFDGAILNAISEGDNYGSSYYYNYYQYYYNEDSN